MSEREIHCESQGKAKSSECVSEREREQSYPKSTKVFFFQKLYFQSAKVKVEEQSEKRRRYKENRFLHLMFDCGLQW